MFALLSVSKTHKSVSRGIFVPLIGIFTQLKVLSVLILMIA